MNDVINRMLSTGFVQYFNHLHGMIFVQLLVYCFLFLIQIHKKMFISLLVGCDVEIGTWPWEWEWGRMDEALKFRYNLNRSMGMKIVALKFGGGF